MSTHRPITFEDIARLPAPGYPPPTAARFSPDGRLITYLFSPAHTLSLELWAYDRESGGERRLLEPPPAAEDETKLSREAQLRRERQRQYATGVTGYAWSETGDTLLVQVGGDVLVRRGAGDDWRTVNDAPGWIDPRLSRDGARLAFVRDAELYALDLTDPAARPRRLTHDASEAGAYGDRVVTNGLAEFVAQEEMGRAAGFWWSPDGTLLAFEQVDHAPVPLFLIPHQGTDTVDVEAHRYPFAGKANVSVRLGVVPVAGGEVRWLPLGDGEESDIYLARVHWTPDGRLIVQVQSRDQTRLDLRRIDPRTGEGVTLWTERVQPWINLTDDLRIVHADDAPREAYTILWSSERGGRRELYLYDRDGRLIRQVSAGDIFIDRVVSVDPVHARVYVEGWDDTPVERHLFRIPLAGGPAQRITRRPGTHLCTLARDHASFIDSFSSLTTPPRVTVRDIDDTEWQIAHLGAGAPPDPRIAELDLTPPEFVTVTTRDGETLHGALYRPRALPPGTKAPVLVDVYGGPHVQQVVNAWAMTVDLRARRFAQEGYVVLVVDNRGAARRGLAFEGAIARNAGDVEVRDQVDGVRSLAAIPEADLDRVGVYGWSYGGYMALMCLARAPEVFKAAVAGAPVTHWDGYDTHYSERYMGTPEENPEGYTNASVMAHVQHIRGKLLLVHGMIDENVHFRHTGRLMQALIRAAVPYDVQLFPEERHAPRRLEDRVFLERRIAEFFERSL